MYVLSTLLCLLLLNIVFVRFIYVICNSSFSLLWIVLFYKYTRMYLPSLLLMDIWFISSLELLSIVCYE